MPCGLPTEAEARMMAEAEAEAEARMMAEAEAEAKARMMAEAEAEAHAMNESWVAAASPASEELIVKLLAAVDVMLSPSHANITEANNWLMQLADAPECWPAALSALERAPSDEAAHIILSLGLSLVRQNRLVGAPTPTALAPVVRRLWAHGGSSTPSPARRQACTLLCAIATLDPHQLDQLLDWPFGLDASESSLSLHVLQDVADEVLQRPLQSKPLAKLLQEVQPDVVQFLEAAAAEAVTAAQMAPPPIDALPPCPPRLVLCLRCLQAWVHTGIVFSELADLPHLAGALISALSCGGGSGADGAAAAAVAAEVLVELIGSVELLPGRPAAVRWLATELAWRVGPVCSASVTADAQHQDAPGTNGGLATAAGIPLLLLQRAPALHAFARTAHALLKNEASALLSPELRPATEQIVGLLLRTAQQEEDSGGGGGGGGSEAGILLPLWEVLLQPAGWSAVIKAADLPVGGDVVGSGAPAPALSAFKSSVLVGLAKACLRCARYPRGTNGVGGGSTATEGGDDLARWRSGELSETLALCVAGIGQVGSCKLAGGWLHQAINRGSGGAGEDWAELEATLFCAAALVRACRGSLEPEARTLWNELVSRAMGHLACPAAAPSPWQEPPLHAAFSLAVAVAEASGECAQVGDGAVFAFGCCLSHIVNPATSPQLAQSAAEALVSICRYAAPSLLTHQPTFPALMASPLFALPPLNTNTLRDGVRLRLLAAHLAVICAGARSASAPSATASGVTADAYAMAVERCAEHLDGLHASIDAAVAEDGEETLEAAVGGVATLCALLLTPRQSIRDQPAASTSACVRATSACAIASDAILTSVLTHAVLIRWLPALRQAAARGGRCARSDGVASEAGQMLSLVCIGAAVTIGGDESLSATSAAAASGRGAEQASVTLYASVLTSSIVHCANAFVAHGHIEWLESLNALLLGETLHREQGDGEATETVAAAAAAAVGATGGAAPSATKVLASTIRLPDVQAAILQALGAAASKIHAAVDDDDLMAPALSLASSLLRLSPEALCQSESALSALWNLALVPLSASYGASASVESRESALQLLRSLVELLGAHASSGAAGSPSVSSQWCTNVAASVRPRMAPLLTGLLSAIAHAAPPSAVSPTALLVHALGRALPAEFRDAIPRAFASLSGILTAAKRVPPPPKATELMQGALLRQSADAEMCVALCTDFAQVVRAGMSVRALERYQR